MLESIAVVLVALWLVGMVTSTTMGGLIHALLGATIVVIFLIRIGAGATSIGPPRGKDPT